MLDRVYTDREQIYDAGALEKLPRLDDDPKLLRIVLQDLGAKSPFVSQSTTNKDIGAIVQAVVKEAISRVISQIGASSRDLEMVGGAGLEPAPLNSQAVELQETCESGASPLLRILSEDAPERALLTLWRSLSADAQSELFAHVLKLSRGQSYGETSTGRARW